MEEIKKEEPKAVSSKPEAKQLVRKIVTDKISIVYVDGEIKGDDVLEAIVILAGMVFTANPDLDYKKLAAHSLKDAIKYVTSGQYSKDLEEQKKKEA